MAFGVVRAGGEDRFAVLDGDRASWDASGSRLPATLDEALSMPAEELRLLLARAPIGELETGRVGTEAALLAPIGRHQEVWASGVTYERSRDARVAEAAEPTVYDRVYDAERPELFLKALPRLVAGPGEPVAIRADSTWNAPEPELTLVVNAHAEIVGYTLGNDMSSRSIEGENPLYLPQAKIYEHCCALGPWVVPAWDIERADAMHIAMTIVRDGTPVFEGTTAVARIRRSFESLVEYLFRALSFPKGVLLLTGTGIVPPEGFTLLARDEVRISCPQIGELVNPVVVA